MFFKAVVEASAAAERTGASAAGIRATSARQTRLNATALHTAGVKRRDGAALAFIPC